MGPSTSSRDAATAPGRLLRRAGRVLPTGDTLSHDAWRTRHAWICRILWAHVVALSAYGIAQGKGVGHTLVEVALIAGLVLGASADRVDPVVRTVLASLALVISSAILVHFSGGIIEMHFHFFVVVFVVSLYQSWLPFLVAVATVILHHGIAGTIDPGAVYNHPSAIERPWTWALIHGVFVLAASVVSVVAWRLNEDALERERATKHSLEEALDDLAIAQQVAAVGSWEWDPRTDEVSWSDELYRIFGVDPSVSPTATTFMNGVHPEDRERVATLVADAQRVGGELDYECRVQRPDDTVRNVHVRGSLLGSGADRPPTVIGTCQDITDRKELEQEVERRAFFDGLTGLANRALFLDRLEHALAVRGRSGIPVTVLYLDLDGFKEINDTLGHRAGDRALVEVARRLRAVVRDADTVARLGGDEFAVLLEDTDTAEARRTAERMLAGLRSPVLVGHRELRVAGSIGIADTANASDADQLLHHADIAMYRAKRAGQGTHWVFDPSEDDADRTRTRLESELADAVPGGQLVLHHQPVVDLATQRIQAIEALVRWDHPTRGLLSPAEFIPAAEGTHHIAALGAWVLTEATRQAAALQQQLGRVVHVHVNVAAGQLVGDLRGPVEDALTRSGLPAGQLTLELTETGLMNRPESAADKLQELRAIGVRIAVDDFGTGYSSLSYLKQLPVDVLKIDRAFIRSVAEGVEDSGLAHAIIKLAGIFGLRTIAEGIETPAQAQRLVELGCELGQGLLYSRPVPAAELPTDLQRWTTERPAGVAHTPAASPPLERPRA